MSENKEIIMDKKGIKPSICFICLGLVLIVAGVCTWFLVFGKDKTNTENKESNTSTNIGPKDQDGTRVLKNGKVTGYSMFNGEGILFVEVDGQEIELKFKNDKFLEVLNSYEDYIRVNITYTESGNNKYLGDYDLVNAKTGDIITGVKDEIDLRNRLGLKNEGTYTEQLKLKTPLENQGIGIDDEGTYTYYLLTFEKDNGEDFKIILKIPEGETRDISFLEAGNMYNLTYEVRKDIVDEYETVFVDVTPIE
jgi:hypothetical protein